MSRIEELEKRLAADPNSRMFVQLAEEYRKAGLLEQAIEVCENGLKKHPQYPSARVALGRALLEAETLDRACEEFEAVLKQVPDNILANKFLGETYSRLGRYEEALQKYRVAHTLAPEDPELGDRIQEVQQAISGAAARPSAGPSASPVPAPPVPPFAHGAMDAPAPGSESSPWAEASWEPEPEASPRPGGDLPPIPLVEVDEPMVLESRDYTPPVSPAPEPAPPPAASGPEFDAVEPETMFPTELEEPLAPSWPGEPPAVEIETPTMAEIYASQGHFDRAIEVYRRISAQKPHEPQHRERLEELQLMAEATRAASVPLAPSDGSASGSERVIQVLERWLAAIRKSREA